MVILYRFAVGVGSEKVIGWKFVGFEKRAGYGEPEIYGWVFDFTVLNWEKLSPSCCQ